MEDDLQSEARLNEMLSLDKIVLMFTSNPVPNNEIINIEDPKEVITVEEDKDDDLDLWAEFELDSDQSFDNM